MKLKNLKILEFAGVLAGPSVGQFFAECGAKVTKVESPAGDITRGWRIPGERTKEGTSAYYLSVNHGKKVIRMNISDPSSRAAFEKLVRSHDIILVNFARETERKHKVSPRDLHRLNPKAIIGKIVGYHDQPDRPAFDLVLQAESGMLSMNGKPGHPAKLPVAFIDLFAAHQLKEGILCALAENKKGILISVSLFDAAIASLANQAGNYLIGGHDPKAQGMQHPNIAPYGEILQTSDKKKIVLAIGTDKQFMALCEFLGLENLASDRRFKINQHRVKHRMVLQRFLQKAASGVSSHRFKRAMANGTLSAGIYSTVGQALDNTASNQFLYYPKGEKIPKTLIFKSKPL